MSLELIAFLERGSAPTYQTLQAAVDSLGDYDLHIDSTYTPFHRLGYVPCVLHGTESGIEISSGPSGEATQLFPRLRTLIGERHHTMTFRFGGDTSECVCALIISAALARSFGALVYYPADDIVYSAEELLQEAEIALSDSG